MEGRTEEGKRGLWSVEEMAEDCIFAGNPT